jgi:hypothetical protein
MKLKIKFLILYPSDHGLSPRFIKFEEEKINVITGYSKRGKSALIPIIDYCLGSSDCDIPVGPIRTLVDKFALFISLGNRQIFIARDSPGPSAKASEVMYLYEVLAKGENPSLNTTEWIADAQQYKTNRDYVKRFLGNVSGFEDTVLESRPVENKKDDGATGFRDTASFLFQPQNIIANPTTIFYKTDTFAHLNRLKTLFPLALGYKSYEILSLEKEIEDLEKKENDAQRKLDDIKRQYENWQSDIYQYYSTAINLNLSSQDISLNTSNVTIIKEELRRIVNNIQQDKYLAEGSGVRYSSKLEELDQSRINLVRELDQARIALRKILEFDRTKQQYINEVTNEVETRLRPVEWFLQQVGTNLCPFCGSESEKAINKLIKLRDARLFNQAIISDSVTENFNFEKEKRDLKKAVEDKEKEILRIDANIRILINEDRQNLRKYQDIFEFGGKIAHVIENLDKISPSSELQAIVDGFIAQLITKRRRLNSLKEQFDKELCLKRVTQNIKEYINILPIENRQNKNVLLDPETSISIRIADTQTRDINFLHKIGSGSNHMCYHLATMLGLHQYFLKLSETGKRNYIPTFLVIDQPSQVYFPEIIYDIPKVEEETNTTKKQKLSEDIENTRLIFAACAQFIKNNSGATQIIILEHAPSSTWQGLDEVNLVEEWRGDFGTDKFLALLPQTWDIGKLYES